MSAVKIAAEKFVSVAKAGGWKIIVLPSIIRIEKHFAPGDNDAYVAADMDAFGVLGLAPLRGGSVWGTDGGSVGGYSGLQNGYYRLSKSGENGKRFLGEVSKLIGGES